MRWMKSMIVCMAKTNKDKYQAKSGKADGLAAIKVKERIHLITAFLFYEKIVEQKAKANLES